MEVNRSCVKPQQIFEKEVVFCEEWLIMEAPDWRFFTDGTTPGNEGYI